VEKAINNALERASKSIRHMGWFEVKEIRGQIQNNQVGHYQVTLEIGFRLDEE
jgi:flavin-binding protein dodecin